MKANGVVSELPTKRNQLPVLTNADNRLVRMWVARRPRIRNPMPQRVLLVLYNGPGRQQPSRGDAALVLGVPWQGPEKFTTKEGSITPPRIGSNARLGDSGIATKKGCVVRVKALVALEGRQAQSLVGQFNGRFVNASETAVAKLWHVVAVDY